MNGIMRNFRAARVGLALMLAAGAPTEAAVPNWFNYQGVLKDNGVLHSGTKSMEFRITDPDGGEEYWNSGAMQVAVSSGLFRVALAPPPTIDWGNISPHLEVKVGGSVLLPRERLNAVAYARHAASAESVAGNLVLEKNAGLTLSGAAGRITTASSVTASAFFGDGSGLTGVRATELDDGSVTTDKLAASAVTDLKILSVSAAKLFGALPAIDGSALTGIGTGTGGVANAGSTTIGADTDADGAGEIAFQTQKTSRMTIANDGKVGIGTTAPGAALDVAGTVKASSFAGDGSLLDKVVAEDLACVGCVGGMALVDEAVTAAKLAKDCDGGEILKYDGALGKWSCAADDAGGAIEDGAVTSAKLGAGAVTTDKLAASAVTDLKILSVSAAKLFGALPAIDGSALTGIGTGTGGVANAGSTTIGADTDADGAGEIAFQTQKTSRMTIANDGKVGIGTSAPGAALDVAGTVKASSFAGDGSALTGVSAAVADGAVTRAKLAQDGCGGGEILKYDGALGKWSCAADEAGGAIEDGAVTSAKLGAGAVTTDKLAADAVTDLKILSVSAAKLFGALPELDGSLLDGVVAEDLACVGCVGDIAIADGSVARAKLAQDGCVGGDILKYDGTQGKWLCSSDNELTGNEVDAYVSDNGYLTAESDPSVNSLGSANLSICTSGQVAKYNGTQWACAADEAGSGGSSPWSASGSNVYYNSGNVGIGITNPLGKLHLSGGNLYYDDTQDVLLQQGSRKLMWTDKGGNLKLGLNKSGDFMLEVGSGVAFSIYDSVNNRSALQYSNSAGKLTAGVDLEVSGQLCISGDCRSSYPYVNSLGQAGLSCSSGQVAKYNGTQWACADDEAGSGGASLSSVNSWSAEQTFSGGAKFQGSGVWNTSGNVGIGTTNPLGKLHLSGGNLYYDDTQDVLLQQGSRKLMWTDKGGNLKLGLNKSGDFNLEVGSGVTFSIYDSVNYRSALKYSSSAGKLTAGVDLEVSGQLCISGDCRSSYPYVNSLGQASLSCASGQVVKYNGTQWACANDEAGSSSPWTYSGSDIYRLNSRLGLGITTASTGAKLSVNHESASTASPQLELRHAGGRNWQFYSTGSSASEGMGKLMIRDGIAGAVRFVIDTNGSVGIGTTSPESKLHIYSGDILAQNGSVEIRRTTTSHAYLKLTGSSMDSSGVYLYNPASTGKSKHVWWDSGGDYALSIKGNSTDDRTNATRLFAFKKDGSALKSNGVSTWEISSDARLKDVGPAFTAGLGEIAKLQPVRYNYKKDNPLGLPSDKENIGLIAQEVRAVIPEAVSADEAGYLKLSADPVLWAMLNAIKELKAENDLLKSRIEALERPAE